MFDPPAVATGPAWNGNAARPAPLGRARVARRSRVKVGSRRDGRTARPVPGQSSLPSWIIGSSSFVFRSTARTIVRSSTPSGLAATAVVAPWIARLVDRHGQARVALPATVIAVLGSLTLLLCVRHDAPDWTLFASYAATATTPNTGGMSRARWAHLLAGDPKGLHTANSFEQAADELCFMLGPVLAAFLCGALFPEAGTLVGAVLPVGQGRRPPTWPAQVLAAGRRDPAVVVMPPHGLTLEEVRYPPDDELPARAALTRTVRQLPAAD